jgi:hypothetical protein
MPGQVDDLDEGQEDAATHQAQPAALAGMPAEVPLPKIRVVVRKRPLNNKVPFAPSPLGHLHAQRSVAKVCVPHYAP